MRKRLSKAFCASAILSLSLLVFPSSIALADAILYYEDGRTMEAGNLPYLKYRSGLLSKLRKLYEPNKHKNMAISAPPPNCPQAANYYWWKWGKKVEIDSSEISTYLSKCTKYFTDKFLSGSNFSKETLQRCQCQIVIKDWQIMQEQWVQIPQKWVRMTLWINPKGSELTKMLGVLEYEKGETGKQNGRILTEEGQEICEGELTYQVGGDGAFDLSCFGGKMNAKGFLRLKIGGKIHAFGSAAMDDGTTLAFITNLSDGEIESKYPGFPEVIPEAYEEEERNDR